MNKFPMPDGRVRVFVCSFKQPEILHDLSTACSHVPCKQPLCNISYSRIGVQYDRTVRVYVNVWPLYVYVSRVLNEKIVQQKKMSNISHQIPRVTNWTDQRIYQGSV